MCVVADLGAGIVLGDPAQTRGDVWSEERFAGLACVAEQRMHGVSANARHGVFECAENVWNGPRVRVLVEEFEAATANHGTLARQTPDEGLDLLRRKLLAAILPCTAATRRHRASRSVALGRDLEAIHDFEIRVHARAPWCRLTNRAAAAPC